MNESERGWGRGGGSGGLGGGERSGMGEGRWLLAGE